MQDIKSTAKLCLAFYTSILRTKIVYRKYFFTIFATMNTTLHQLMAGARHLLAATYGDREAAAMVDEMMLRIKGWDRVQTAIRATDPASDFLTSRVNETVQRLLDGQPIQYIFGKAHFYGMDFTVTPDTLIPRPETAQLVDMIVDRYGRQSDLRVLDLGTGSGCIAIALARNLTFPKEIAAIDISSKALDVARSNAAALKVSVNFIQADMLDTQSIVNEADGSFDIIVSNPPYIAASEAKDMERHVLDHEPHSALFVPDSDPLLFYRAIASIAEKTLAPAGTLYLEINPLFAKQLADMLRAHGFSDIDIVKDMQQADRFIIAKR